MKAVEKFALGMLLIALHGFAQSDEINIIDTHAHLETSAGTSSLGASVKTALSEMDRVGISRSILMPQPYSNVVAGGATIYDAEDLVAYAKGKPDRFSYIGGGATLNRMLQGNAVNDVSDSLKQQFRERAESILALGASGFGEIAIEHYSLPMLGAKHPYEAVPGDHPLLLLLMDIAAEHDVPIDIHFDANPEDRPLPENLRAPLNPSTLHENVAAFERFLMHNQKTKVVWAHVGSDPGRTRTVELCRQLLSAHPNLYMSFRIGPRGPGPLMPLNEDGSIKSPWLELVQDFPDRFVIGSDQFYPPEEAYRRTPTLVLDSLRIFVNNLPPDLASKVAYENARRIYKLP